MIGELKFYKMIIGDGLLGSAFMTKKKDYEKFVVFASGVSNSLHSDELSFEREKLLVLKTLNDYKDSKFIYFSSVLTGIIDNNYYNHKIEIEELIKNNSNNYIIFRVPQIIGGTGNKHNLVNHIKNLILNNEEVVVYKNVYRALLDVDDLVKIVDYFKDTTLCETIYISNIEKISVLDIVNIISNQLKIKAKIKMVDSENNNWFYENDMAVDDAISNIGIVRSGYANNVIKKYINN